MPPPPIHCQAYNVRHCVIFPYEHHKCGHVHTFFFSFFQTDDNKAWTSETVEYDFMVTVEEFPDSEYIGKYVVSVVGPTKCVLIKRVVLLFQGVHSVLYTCVATCSQLAPVIELKEGNSQYSTGLFNCYFFFCAY